MPSNTDNHVHPFFAPERFSNIQVYDDTPAAFLNHPINPDFYALLKPALCLATVLLKKSQPFLLRVLYAPVVPTEQTNRMGQADTVFHPQFQPNVFDYQNFEDDLARLMDRTRICWLSAGQLETSATAGSTTSYHMSWVHSNDGDSVVYRVGISTALLRQLTDASWHRRPATQKAAVYVLIAITLIHETCHLLFFYRNRVMVNHYRLAGATPPQIIEPMILPRKCNELGFAWEHWMLGGSLWPARRVVSVPGVRMKSQFVYDCSEGVQLHVEDQEGTAKEIRDVKPECLEAMMTERFWREGKKLDLGDPLAVEVGKNGMLYPRVLLAGYSKANRVELEADLGRSVASSNVVSFLDNKAITPPRQGGQAASGTMMHLATNFPLDRVLAINVWEQKDAPFVFGPGQGQEGFVRRRRGEVARAEGLYKTVQLPRGLFASAILRGPGRQMV
ncbi:hypothetical protein LTR66_016526 [Elasticomyces elasticus]|nr:hypothetical protein LTR66_016526 [Elasticomyces elasticus]